MKNIKIGKININSNSSPIFIAEMSGNHNQSLDRALKLVDLAAKSGANIIKLQTYKPDTMTLDLNYGDFKINDKKSLWHKKSLYELYKIGSTPWEWHKKIIERAKKNKILCISTPFDETAVDFLENLKVPAYKIASFENTDYQLLKKVAKTNKPIILSTGMASIAEIHEALHTIKSHGKSDVILLKCTSSYPANPKDSNLVTIKAIREIFNCHVGLSDHTLGIGTSVASVVFGAKIIEKHFTLNRSEGGIDSAFSLEPDEFKNLVKETKKAYKSIGNICFGATNNEKQSLQFRRSLYISKDVKKGEIITKKNIKNVRPGFGISTKHYNEVLGRKFNASYKIGTPLTWKVIT